MVLPSQAALFNKLPATAKDLLYQGMSSLSCSLLLAHRLGAFQLFAIADKFVMECWEVLVCEGWGMDSRYFRNHFEPGTCFMIACDYKESIQPPRWSLCLMGFLLRLLQAGKITHPSVVAVEIK